MHVSEEIWCGLDISRKTKAGTVKLVMTQSFGKARHPPLKSRLRDNEPGLRVQHPANA